MAATSSGVVGFGTVDSLMASENVWLGISGKIADSTNRLFGSQVKPKSPFVGTKAKGLRRTNGCS